MTDPAPPCSRRESIEAVCSCPKRDCPRHGVCCECLVAHKGRVGDPLLKRLPHCLRDLVAGGIGAGG